MTKTSDQDIKKVSDSEGSIIPDMAMLTNKLIKEGNEIIRASTVINIFNMSGAALDELRNVQPFAGKYGLPPGNPALVAEIVSFMNKEYPGNGFAEENVLPTQGAIHGLSLIIGKLERKKLLVMTVGGDMYPSYSAISKEQGCECYKLDIDHIDTILQKDPREIGSFGAILINFPHNPSGKILSETEAEEMAKSIEKIANAYPDLKFIFDEAYFGMEREDKKSFSPYNYLSAETKLKSEFVFSGSKLHSMANQRIGFLATKNKESFKNYTRTIGSELICLADQPQKALRVSMSQYSKDPVEYKEMVDLCQRLDKAFIEELNPILDEKHQIEAADSGLCVVADFSQFIGYPIPEGKRAIVGKDFIENSTDLAKYFLTAPEVSATEEKLSGVSTIPLANMKLRFAFPDPRTTKSPQISPNEKVCEESIKLIKEIGKSLEKSVELLKAEKERFGVKRPAAAPALVINNTSALAGPQGVILRSNL